MATRAIRPLSDLPLTHLRQFFSDAAAIDSELSKSGGHEVLDAAGARLGYVLQTSPASDGIVGFSGSTNVLIAFGKDHRILGLSILSSDDTTEHVEAVLEDEFFLSSFAGQTRDEAARESDVDAVSGATLTSRAIQEAIIRRLGGQRTSLRFPEGLTVLQARGLFPNAELVEKNSKLPSLWDLKDGSGAAIGTVLCTSPFADDIVGYQGPTETLIGLNPAGRIVGIAVRRSFDNEPYVGYVRDDAYFKELFEGLVLDELLSLNLEEAEIEGVSGATLTSLAVAEGLIRAAADHRDALEAQAEGSRFSFSMHDLGAALTVCLGLVVGLTRLRSKRSAQIAWQLILIGYLGLTAGILVSQASFVGWAQNGLPWRTAPGFVLLSVAALLFPMAARRNIYCSHLCPHGAAQGLLRRTPLARKWRVRIERRHAKLVETLPSLLLIACVVVPMLSLPLSLVDIEPFDAWVFRLAGWATVTIAVVGLVASFFVPMAYCRFGCPTGALLGFLKLDARSGLWTRRDWLAVALVALAACLYIS